MKGLGNGGSSGDLPCQSLGSIGSSSAMRRRRMVQDQTCFCGLKTLIKKSGTSENPDRLFHTCARYRKGSHCNLFRWVDDDGYEGVAKGGGKADAETGVEVGGNYDEWRLNVSWRVGTLEGEVRALKMLIVYMSITMAVATVICASLLILYLSK